MSLWARIQYLSTDAKQRIHNKYAENQLSLDVRHYLAVWIENNIIYENNAGASEERIAMICSALIAEIKKVADAVGNNMDFSQIRLRSTAQFYQTLQPSVLYSRLIACLNEEMKVLNEQNNLELPSSSQSTNNEYQDEAEKAKARQCSNYFSQRVCILTNNRKEWSSLVETMHCMLDELHLIKEKRTTAELRFQLVGNQRPDGMKDYEQFKRVVEMGLQKMDKEIANHNTQILQLELGVIELAQVIVTELNNLVRILLQEYIHRLKWSELTSEEQNLDNIQRWYAELLDTIAPLRCLKTVYLQQIPPALVQQLMEQLDSMFFILVSNSLVVQEQPSQVIKKDTKFNTSVRFLLGERFINPEGSPVVKVSAVNERYAALLFQSQSPSKVSYNGHGKVINNVERKFCDSDSQWCQRVVMQFRNVAISSVKRGEKDEHKCGNRAMTEKFCLLFSSKLEINGKAYEVWCCSLPFVFTVHVSQKCEGWGNIFWDNSFRERGRIPFNIPQEVCWAQMAPALRKCFKSMTQTNWNLTESNLKYIGEKTFRMTNFNENSTISRKEFCEKETTSKICPWEWFYSIIELINKHLKPFWGQGYIVGFMDRCHAERDILARMKAGTFMLRFSDSNLGGISISYAVPSPNGHGLEVASLAPFTDSDLKVRSLSDRINDAAKFLWVYYHNSENQERLATKETAFPVNQDKKHLSPKVGFGSGKLPVKSQYVEARVMMVLFGSNGNSNGESGPMSPLEFPSTPSSFSESEETNSSFVTTGPPSTHSTQSSYREESEIFDMEQMEELDDILYAHSLNEN